MAADETHLATDERGLVMAFLDYARGGVLRKVDGLSDEAAREARTASGTSLGGLVKHLTWVERSWLQYRFLGGEMVFAWTEEDPDADMRMEPQETLAELIADYGRAAEETRVLFAAHELDEVTKNDPQRGPVSLRWIGWHLVEETARHAGHLDILREQLDGVVGD
jgi:uncharacterized damage-inducible protein DinB